MASNLRVRAHLHVFARVLTVTAVVATSLLAFPLRDPMPLLAEEDPPDYLLTLGTRGSDPGEFESPDDVAVGLDGLIYVADETNYRVQVIDAAGNSVRAPWASGMFGYPTGVAVDVNGTVHVCDADDSYERITAHDPFTGAIQYTWGSSAEFSGPQGIAATSVGGNVYIYVADTLNKRIRKFSYDASSGYTHVLSWDGSEGDAGQMNDPRGVAVAPDGSVYVTDTSHGRVVRFTSDGVFLDEWGTRVPGGTAIGEFWDPEGIAVDADGDVYVVDTGNHRVQKFTADGVGLCVWNTGDGSFNYPGGVAVDRYGIVYLVDSGNHRIQVFGEPQDPPEFLAKFGTEGTGDGEFGQNRDVAVDTDGNAFVVDTTNDRVQRFTPTGTSGAYEHDATWGGAARSGVGEFGFPEGLCADDEGNIYVTDYMNGRVQKYDGDAWAVIAGSGSSSPTPSDGNFYLVSDVAVASDGTMYVTDGGTNRIQVFTYNPSTEVYTYDDKWGSSGTGDGQFDRPYGIALDDHGYVYVSDYGHHRIQKFDSDGNFICKWGSEGTGEGQFKFPRGVAIDSEGYLYVVEYLGHRVQKFTGNGIYLTQWGTQGGGDGQFERPCGITLDGEGNVFVADTMNHRVQVFGVSAAQEFSMDLEAGLHMVSIPVQGADMSVDTLFPDGTTVRTWDPDTKSYVEATTIDPTKSYWVDVPSECTVTVSGTPLDGWTATLSAGWHMIGSLYGDPVGVETISADPSSALEGSSVYCWNPSTGRYDVATQIEQGKGYWVALSEACELTVGTPGGQ